ncbi:hypothetical protein UWK_00564 [Desulfocapsa sulfexigens DSM 10523]|uniref:TIGR03016 family PEP-CTERM system-associated outer membrane protein n=1 Tax=Desulfocapsa sulfexigens (strain DSM 10523 / SB164P1) TaxID=1167006 RepID=M1PBK1_DESSD|nr:hypothetical protein [Desulfocapsa sulfexigens]AGF77145.1 hypothetical protein UWK_00564 [Desulfocapsa sulfexigens DSM 10523]
MHSSYNLFPVTLFVLLPLFFLLMGPVQIQAAEETETGEVQAPTTPPVSSPIPRPRMTAVPNGLLGQNYFIKRPGMGAGLTYEYKDESRTTSGTTVKDSYHRFKERVRLQTDGWLYHPALMQYSLMIEPEWIQSKEVNTSGETGRVNSFSPDYAMTATFLQQKPYTFNFFASRRESPVWAAFAGDTETLVDTYGTNIRLKYKILPTVFGYSHVKTDQQGYYSSENIRDNFHFTSRHQNNRSSTSFSSTYSDDRRSTEDSDTKITTFNNSLTNNYQITSDNTIKLNSFLTYRTQDSDVFDTANLRLREQLNWRHRANLRSNYSFTHTLQETDNTQSERTALDARLTHLLYENLTTNVGSKGSLYDYSGGRENAFNTFLNFTYTRPISWGTLNLNSGWDYLYTDRSGFTSSIAQVTNEPHTLSPATETYLANYGVRTESIVVTNTPGTIIYIENIDYSVDTIGDYTRINFLSFGSIAAGQSVMVSYSYTRDAEYDDGIATENYGMNIHLFNSLDFSYNYLHTKQHILSGLEPKNKIDDTIHRFKIRHYTNWADTTFHYEDNDRVSNRPFTRWELQETLSYRPAWQVHFSLKGYFGQTSYTDDNETKDFYGGVTTFDWLLNRWCRFRLEGYYDNINGDVEQTENIGVKAGLEFRYRIWTARLTYELTDQNNIITDYERTKQLLRFEIIRIMW